MNANHLETTEAASVAFGRRHEKFGVELDCSEDCGIVWFVSLSTSTSTSAAATGHNLKEWVGAGNVDIRRHARGRGTSNNIRRSTTIPLISRHHSHVDLGLGRVVGSLLHVSSFAFVRRSVCIVYQKFINNSIFRRKFPTKLHQLALIIPKQCCWGRKCAQVGGSLGISSLEDTEATRDVLLEK